MPTLLLPLYEFNPCHSPAGSPAGGEFCGGTRMPDAPSRYFRLDAQTVMVPLDQLDTIHARSSRAELFLRGAYAGTHRKRKPVTLRKKFNGRYEVVDGNSTTALARQHGWKALPAHVVA